MSDVGKVRRIDGSPFPSVRKSADPFVPEMGQIDFSHEVREFDAHISTSVQESEKAEQNIIDDETRRRQFRQRQRKRKEEEEKNAKPKEDEENFVDLTA
jgi:hypothetical protein